MEVRVHGDTAVVLGITHTKGISAGKPFDAKFQFTDTFVKDGGQWRLFAGHVTRVPQEANNNRATKLLRYVHYYDGGLLRRELLVAWCFREL